MRTCSCFRLLRSASPRLHATVNAILFQANHSHTSSLTTQLQSTRSLNNATTHRHRTHPATQIPSFTPHLRSMSHTAAAPSHHPRPTLRPADVRVLVPIADGTEEVEATSIITVFRRAGCNVTVASCASTATTSSSSSLTLTGARGALLTADVALIALETPVGGWTAIALPGGKPGAERFRDTPALIDMLRAQRSAGRLIAAICASPAIVLQSHGLLPPRRTGHPSFELVDADSSGGDRRDDGRVVYDAEWNTVTSQGPGSAIEFALHCVGLLCGDETARQVAQPMCLNFTPQPTAKL